jgi:hypothetical protein
MDNFDLRKYLVENKVTTNSRMINEQENTKYFQLGYNYGPNAKLNIDPNMPEWKTISQLANDLYNTGVPLNSLEQNNAAVEFTKGYIASIATNSVRYQGLSSIINALGSVEENGHRENYLPGAEMMKENEADLGDKIDELRDSPDHLEFVDDEYEYNRFEVGTVDGTPYLLVDNEILTPLSIPVSKFIALFKKQPFFNEQERFTVYYSWDQDPEVENWLKQYKVAAENKVTTNSRILNEYLEDEGSVQDAFTEAGIEDSDTVTLVVSMFREEETLDPMPASEAIEYIEKKSRGGELERQYSFDDIEDNGALINISLGDEISIDVFTDREIIRPSQAPRDFF